MKNPELDISTILPETDIQDACVIVSSKETESNIELVDNQKIKKVTEPNCFILFLIFIFNYGCVVHIFISSIFMLLFFLEILYFFNPFSLFFGIPLSSSSINYI